MQYDDLIWEHISHGSCSFFKKTITQNFCSNQYNIIGMCRRDFCPLANSRYATIIEEKGECYLYIKTIERAHTPEKLWERIKLPRNYQKATEVIKKELAYWPNIFINRNKIRLLKIHQYLARMRRLITKVAPEIVPRIAHREKIERKHEKKAHTAAHIQDSIKSELLNRLKKGVYGDLYDSIVNYTQESINEVFDKIDNDGFEFEEESEESDQFVEAYDEDDEVEYEYEMEKQKPVREKASVPVKDFEDEFDVAAELGFSDNDEKSQSEEEKPVVKPKSSFAERAKARNKTKGKIRVEE